MKKTLWLAAALFVAVPVLAQSEKESYCRYIEQQAEAQAVQLRTPQFETGITPNQGTKSQVIAGLNGSISDWRKARFTQEIARQNCQAYETTVDTQKKIQYSIAALEKDALSHRLSLLGEASNKIDKIIQDNGQLLQAQNLTIQSVYTVEAVQSRLFLDESHTQASMASLYVPELSKSSIITLVVLKNVGNTQIEHAQNQLIKANNWSLNLRAGMRHDASPLLQNNAGPYVGFNFTYNLGHKHVNDHLARSEDSLREWKSTEYGNIEANAEILHQTLVQSLSAQTSALAQLSTRSKLLADRLGSVQDPQTTAAIVFRNQLTVDQILLTVEIRDVEFRISQLQQYLQDNF